MHESPAAVDQRAFAVALVKGTCGALFIFHQLLFIFCSLVETDGGLAGMHYIMRRKGRAPSPWLYDILLCQNWPCLCGGHGEV